MRPELTQTVPVPVVAQTVRASRLFATRRQQERAQQIVLARNFQGDPVLAA